jgi:hypothetical protein
LDSVQWGEYKLGDLFEVNSYKKRFDANKVEVLENGKYPYVVRMSTNNGQKGYIDEDEIYLNEGNTISFGQDTATMFYQEKPYFTGDKIKILKAKNERFNKNNAQFFIATMMKSFSSFSWGSSSFSVKVIENQQLSIPIRDGKIDFEFMESFVAELEDYLTVTGLKDCELTEEEKEAIEEFNKIEWSKFKFDEVFERIEQGRRLKTSDQVCGDIPFVMSGVTNSGVANYISNPINSFPSNSITVDIFGNTFYRNFEYSAGDDTGVYWSEEKKYSQETMLFLTTSVKKALVGKYSYGNKLRSSQSKKIPMQLPTVNKEVNYRYMNIFISAIKKLVIKDVILWADKKIEATKKIINGQNP